MSSILAENWSSIQVEEKSFSVKCLFESDGYEIVLLDLSAFKLYHLKQEETEILELFKELNKALDVPFAKILAHVKDCLLGKNETNAKFAEGASPKKGGPYVLSFQSKLAGFKFNWQFKFAELPAASWKDHVVVPLLQNVAEYQLRESELVKLIQSKDKELEDYRAQGFKLTRKYLNTDTFNQEAFDEAISNKQEAVSYLKSPEKCLYSESFKVVNKSRASKARKLAAAEAEAEPQVKPKAEKVKKPVSDEETDASSSSSSDGSKKVKPECPSSQETKKETSRLEELQKTLKEEAKRNEKKQNNQKKKKFL